MPSAASLLILAGGQSRRMGSPKALLPVAGATLLEWVIERLRGHFAEVLVVVAGPARLPEGLKAEVVVDRRPGSGPLAGLEAGLAAAGQDRIVAVACDMPWVTGPVADALAGRLGLRQAVVPVADGRPQPACAAYDRTALPVISSLLDEGEHRLLRLLERLDTEFVPAADLGASAETFANLNTRAEYEAFLAALRHHG